MRYSAYWVYQQIADSLNARYPDYYAETLPRLGFSVLSGIRGSNSFWLNESVKISPKRQVQVLKNIYSGQFEFDPENIRTTTSLIPILTYKDLVFRGKTGTYINTSNAISWLIGRCERGDHTFYFATMFRQALNEFDVSNIRKTNIELSGKILSELKPE